MKENKTFPTQVVVRIRPIQNSEKLIFWEVNEDLNQIKTISHSINQEASYEVVSKKLLIDSIYSPKAFDFDRIYTPQESTEDIYDAYAKNMLKQSLQGISSTIFMFGMTNSGKTYTTIGNVNSPGLVICFLRDIFEEISKESDKINVYCTYLEIYNENVKCLLSGKDKLTICNDESNGTFVKDAKSVKIKSFEDGLTMLDKGEEEKKVRSNVINKFSSRSHTIFQLVSF